MSENSEIAMNKITEVLQRFIHDNPPIMPRNKILKLVGYLKEIMMITNDYHKTVSSNVDNVYLLSDGTEYVLSRDKDEVQKTE